MSDTNVQNMRSRESHDRDNGNIKNNSNNNSNNRFRVNAEDDQLANYQKVPAGKIGSDLCISKELLRHIGQFARHCADAHEYNMKTMRSFADLMRYFDELANEMDREETSSNEARDTTKELKSPDSIQSEVPLIMRPRILDEMEEGTNLNDEAGPSVTKDLERDPKDHRKMVLAPQKPIRDSVEELLDSATPIKRNLHAEEPTTIHHIVENVSTLQLNVAAANDSQNQSTWTDRVANQRLRNADLRAKGESNFPDQGIGFNEDGYPVDKATTPREVWDRSWVADTQQNLRAEINAQPSREIRNSISPQSYDDHNSLGSSTSRRSHSDQHEREHSQRDNKSREEDNRESDSEGRDANKSKGKTPTRRHRTPWDDDPSLSDSSSSSKSLSSLSSRSEDDWLDNLMSNKGLDSKAKRKLRRKAVQKLRAKTEDDDRRESWLKNIIKDKSDITVIESLISAQKCLGEFKSPTHPSSLDQTMSKNSTPG